MEMLEHKLRLLRNTVALQGSAPVFLERNKQGEVIDFQVLDPTSVHKLFTEEGTVPEPPNPAYQQIWDGYPKVSLTTEQVLMVEHLQPGEIYPGVKAPNGIVAA